MMGLSEKLIVVKLLYTLSIFFDSQRKSDENLTPEPKMYLTVKTPCQKISLLCSIFYEQLQDIYHPP